MANKSLDSARAKGSAAQAAGQPVTSNPYGDARTDRGSVTFARAFHRAWRDGWETAEKAAKVADLRKRIRTCFPPVGAGDSQRKAIESVRADLKQQLAELTGEQL